MPPIVVLWVVVFPIFMLCVANGWMLGALGCFAVLFVGNLITIVSGRGSSGSAGYGTRSGRSWDDPGYVANDPFSAHDDPPRRSSSWSEPSHHREKSSSGKSSSSGGKSWKTEKSYSGGGGKFGGGGASKKW